MAELVEKCSDCGRFWLELKKGRCPRCYGNWKYGVGWQKKYNDRRPKGKPRGPKRWRPAPPAPNTPCEICGTKEQKLCMDHIHEICGHEEKIGVTIACEKCFRGWLCRSCNALLGMAKDHPEILKAAAKYLTKHAEAG